MITLRSIDYTYSSGGTVLADISLHIEQGKLIGLVGANGSGKSTLLSLISGLFTPENGTVHVAEMQSPGDERRIRSICRMVMQDADLQILGATVEEDLLLGRTRSAEAEKLARKMATRFDLIEAWERPVQTLSWGMKRKVCLAAALLDEPDVLLLDEPFSGLDYAGMREMRAMIVENKEAGLTQMISSHDLECLVDLVDELAVLDQGRLAAFGPPEQVLDHVREHGVRPPSSWSAGLGIIPWDGGK